MSLKYFAKKIEVNDKVRCNNCMWEGDENLFTCPKCNSDEYMMQPYMKLFLCSNEIHQDDKVIIMRATDDTADSSLVDQIGFVYEINCNGLTGNTKSDPLYRVLFPSGKKSSFWKEELSTVLGEISSEAIWVKEGDEFDEDEVGFHFTDDDTKELLCKEWLKRTSYTLPCNDFTWVILNPSCQHFH